MRICVFTLLSRYTITQIHRDVKRFLTHYRMRRGIDIHRIILKLFFAKFKTSKKIYGIRDNLTVSSNRIQFVLTVDFYPEFHLLFQGGL